MKNKRKIKLLTGLIQDAEWRIGNYIVADGCEKTDQYAQDQIEKVKCWYEELQEVLDGSN